MGDVAEMETKNTLEMKEMGNEPTATTHLVR